MSLTNSVHKFNDKAYWKERHAADKSLKASGLKSVNLKAVDFIYKILAEQYRGLLDRLEVNNLKNVLDCGFGDGYFLKFFNQYYPKLELYGVDISHAAKEKVKLDRCKLFVADLTTFNLKKKFDLVHCFDVLYHILDEAEHRNALENLADHSNKYVVLHERFFSKTPIISSRHVRFRRRELTNQILNSRGFYLHSQTYSHFVAVRLGTYWLNRFIPEFLYNIDKKIATWPANLQEALASHSIRVYKKADR